MLATVEKQMFKMDVKRVGLPRADKNKRARAVYQNSMKYRPSVCAQCESALLCGVCSQGGWLI